MVNAFNIQVFIYLIYFNLKFYLKGQIFGEKSEMSQPIVLIHGYLDNSNSFKLLAPFLIKNTHFYLIAIDLPGR